MDNHQDGADTDGNINHMKQDKPIKLRMDAATYYIWVGGSCDYAHEERAGGGAYIMEKAGKVVERYDIADLHTTEFRMMLSVMLHAMEVPPETHDMAHRAMLKLRDRK